MKVSVHESGSAMAEAAAGLAAEHLRRALRARGQAAFVAATGASQFEFLDQLVKAPDIAWERLTMFHLDEYIGMGQDHPASFRRYLQERLVSRVPIGTVHYIAGDAPDLGAELARLNRLLGSTPVEVAFVGIGENAHLAFNDPPADFSVTAPYIVAAVRLSAGRHPSAPGPVAPRRASAATPSESPDRNLPSRQSPADAATRDRGRSRDASLAGVLLPAGAWRGDFTRSF
ncbi:MAG: 6-phosphogluconolactonase [Candidatus Methylomirabilales bacterium]